MKIRGRRSDSRTGNRQRPRSFRADRGSASHRRALRRGAPRRAPAPPGQGCGETRSVDLLPTQAPHGGDYRARCKAPEGSFRVTVPTPATTTHLVLRPNWSGVLLDILEAFYDDRAEHCWNSNFEFRISNFPSPNCIVQLEPPVGVALLWRASSRGSRDVVSWCAPACQMAAYRGPQQRPGATAAGAAKPPRRPRG